MALTTLFASAVLVGCGEEPVVVAPVVKAAPVKAPEPEPVKVATIKELMAKYDIDQRVDLPENRAPETEVASPCSSSSTPSLAAMPTR